MAGIQTRVPDGRGGYDELTVHDARYWEGPYTYQEYPKAVYRQVWPGRVECVEPKTSEAHERLGPGWYLSPADAEAAFERREAEEARVAAARLYADQRLSVRAQEEALARDRATDLMLPDLGEAPKKRSASGRNQAGRFAKKTPVAEG
jgi:hypothetical protein